MNRKSEAVDIIVPVYNGYDDLQLCIPSVKKHTDLKKHRLILINDCSPDERIAPYLDSLADENILILHNEKNLGFSGNVNKGMQLSDDRDVLLLNSDTIVTEGWIEKIAACAYMDDSTGTVTPLSNSATLCSVPVMCQDNPIPEGQTVDSYAALIERCSLKRYPRITVAVGFCMFIKRVLIEDIGYFDAATFGRGYGEENDFCNRAEQAGYHHLLCDDTFVYHKGTASFETEEKQKLLQAHEAILNERYPEQMWNNHLYCMKNPDQEIRDNLIMYTKLNNGKKNLLYMLHLDFREHAFNNIGGTQIHVRELMEVFREEYNVFVAARDRDMLCVTAYTETEEFTLKFEIGEAPKYPVFRDRELRKIYDQILMAFQIDLVHVHHVQDLSLELFYAADALEIPVMATLHDYFAVCPTILLLDGENRFCMKDDPNLTEEERKQRCASCLKQKKDLVPQTDYLNIWRREFRKALQLCRKLIFPTEAAKEIVLQYYPELREKSIAVYHGEDEITYSVEHAEHPENVQKNSKLKIRLDRVVGADQGLNDIKGWAYLPGINNEETELFVELTDSQGVSDCFVSPKTARPDIVDAFGDPDALMCGIDLRISTDSLADGPVKIHVYVKHGDTVWSDGQTFRGEYRRRFGKQGRLNVAFLGGMVPQKGSRMAGALIPMDQERINWFVLGAIGDKDIIEIRQENCFFSSTYKKSELPQLLKDNDIDVVCILPIWAETFCYTVSEAWMNGIPVLGTDIGAVGERIRATGAGWLVPEDASPEKVLELLHQIQDHPEEYAQKKALAEQMRHKTVEEMCQEYRGLYLKMSGEGEWQGAEDGVVNSAKNIVENTIVKAAEFENAAGREKTEVHGDAAGRERAAVLEHTVAFERAEKKKTWQEQIDYDFIFQGLALGNPSINGKGGVASMNRLRNENAALKSYIEVVQGTSSYRLARKIADVKIPFKEQIKKIVRKTSQK